jgi:hypothetical protein
MEAVPKRLLLFAATTGYQIREFADAARRLGLELTLATDHCERMGDPWGDGALAVKFDHRMMGSLDALRELEFDGVAAVGDRPAVAAAATAEMLGIPFHPAAAARACHDKYLARQLYQAAGMRTPWFWRAALDENPAVLARRAEYPCVLKPLGLSGSRGVIRANDEAEFAAAFRRIAKIGERHLQVERYIPGREFAVEGLVTAGRFQALAIFDKPDPLEGPFFEESIYVTPSRETPQAQRDLVETAARAVRALGLRHGPVHAELRHNPEGAWMLEMHARPIGGLCARTLRFEGGMSLEELILRHAVGDSQGRDLRKGGRDRAGGGGGGNRRRGRHRGGRAAVGAVARGSQLPGIPVWPRRLAGRGGRVVAAVARGAAVSHRDRFGDVQALVFGGTKSGGRAAPSPKK